METNLKVYMEPVGEILRAHAPGCILDMPSGSGWLTGHVPPGTEIDGIDLFQPRPRGYRNFVSADLDDGIPDRLGQYDAIVTTPNIWYPEAKLKYLARGFFPGFPSLVGHMAKGSHMHITPWSFPWLYLYLSLAGFTGITLHDLDQPKPKHRWAKIFGWPQIRYCRRKARSAETQEECRYWEICGTAQSVYGRNLVVSATFAG